MLDLNEKDFTDNNSNLSKLIFNEKMMNFCNENWKASIVLQYTILYNQYYNAVINLDQQNITSSIYPIARSAVECFSVIYGMIENFDDDNLFKEKEIAEYKANISQIYKIYMHTTNNGLKNQLYSRLINLLTHINAINGSETKEQVEQICKSYKNNISDKVTSAFSNLDGYSDDSESFSNLYPELCLYSHNNIDSLIERFFDNINDKKIFNLRKKDKNIMPIKYMFSATSIYLIRWLEEITNE